ncbi:hypothetical protein ACVWWK_003926 [Bradyrhizobium sp. LB9.1b]
MAGEKPPNARRFRVGFRTSIIAVFVGVVLAVGLSLVWLSFERVTRITYNAATGFIEKVAQLGADHVDEQFTNVRDNLRILTGLPSIRSADIVDNPRLYAVLASMLRNNPQLFNLYVGYDDGSFPRNGRHRSRLAGLQGELESRGRGRLPPGGDTAQRSDQFFDDLFVRDAGCGEHKD